MQSVLKPILKWILKRILKQVCLPARQVQDDNHCKIARTVLAKLAKQGVYAAILCIARTVLAMGRVGRSELSHLLTIVSFCNKLGCSAPACSGVP
jgi:hypothetical protein